MRQRRGRRDAVEIDREHGEYVIRVDGQPWLEIRGRDAFESLRPAVQESVLRAVGAMTATVTVGERHRASLDGIPAERRRPVGRAVDEMAEILVASAGERDVSTRQLEERAQTAVDAFRVVISGSSRQLRTLIQALDRLDGPEELTEEEVEAHGRVLQQALYHKLVRESYSISEIADRFGLSRQRVKQLRDEDRLFAVHVPYQRSLLYPRWQFDAQNRVRDGLPALVAVAREAGLDAIGFHQVMTNPDAGNGTAPAALLDQGCDELVIGILRAADR